MPWDQIPLKLKQQLGLPSQDRGIDSLSLDGKVAVQAKDYTDATVPLSRLWGFYFMCTAVLRHVVERMVVATSETTRLPRDWESFSGAELRKYAIEEFDQWRAMAKLEQSSDEERLKVRRKDLERWPHQVDCLESCVDFLNNQHQRYFFCANGHGFREEFGDGRCVGKTG